MAPAASAWPSCPPENAGDAGLFVFQTVKHNAVDAAHLGPLGLGTPVTKGLWGWDLRMRETRPKHFQRVSFGSTDLDRGTGRTYTRNAIEEATMRFATNVMRVDRIALAIGFGTSAAQESASAQARDAALGSRSPLGSTRKVTNHVTSRQLHRGAATMTMYCITDRLHNGRTVQVPGHEIAPVVSAWLAELGADSPRVEDFARAACAGDWAAAYAVGSQLSVDVTIAAAA